MLSKWYQDIVLSFKVVGWNRSEFRKLLDKVIWFLKKGVGEWNGLNEYLISSQVSREGKKKEILRWDSRISKKERGLETSEVYFYILWFSWLETCWGNQGLLWDFSFETLSEGRRLPSCEWIHLYKHLEEKEIKPDQSWTAVPRSKCRWWSPLRRRERDTWP